MKKFIIRLKNKLEVTTQELFVLFFITSILILGLILQILESRNVVQIENSSFLYNYNYNILKEDIITYNRDIKEDNSDNSLENESKKNTADKNKKSEDILSGKININTAGVDELTKLPGIGEKTAQAIIEYRTKNGKFVNISDLMNVKGIGQKKFEKIESFITTK
ncbi:MAG TPA: helix-hairpin-helix domain-containing protein [Ignavibacteriales bacterium]|nr:helix-hairpin-helix domain-containing protein [Ignavibacteriales bacterium]HOL81645.1 helix-hairpin-helix domain-containing protein [Ignavibacteriales bacterium]HOM65174.1 helix-hairpin-helix domain-containing protein [Ignavibacteriales bacterium]HPD66898.1 helix-hairpin-helix domain-containing protein [Ignavibacteriales bacterium]HPP33759.1 helix-hairpin-helix domain-containing protein [Ignavibacteriales bacterium]